MEIRKSATLVGCGAALLAVAAVAATMLDKPRTVHIPPPPPPKVTVTTPVAQKVIPYLDVTGTTVAVNTVDLVARVQGFLQEISYKDGSLVHAGDNLFTIEPLPYQARLQQAQAAEAAAAAVAKNAAIEYGRQSQLGKSNVASQATVDAALAKRDSTAGNLDQAKANTQIAAINYTYTRVAAPFDGIVTAHLQSVGQLVGTTPTVLATLVQLDPIYVTFNISDQGVPRMRADGKRVVEVGLQSETGYPHQGVIDYIAPQVSAGTLQVRGIFENDARLLLPGLPVRVRVAQGEAVDSLLVPATAIASDQGGQYLLVVNADNVVEQRRVTPGGTVGPLRVIASGLQREDRVVVGGIQHAVPGDKVDPQPQAPASPTS